MKYRRTGLSVTTNIEHKGYNKTVIILHGGLFIYCQYKKLTFMKKFHSALFDFCWFPNYDASIEYLANNIADPEPWDFSDATQANIPF